MSNPFARIAATVDDHAGVAESNKIVFASKAVRDPAASTCRDEFAHEAIASGPTTATPKQVSFMHGGSEERLRSADRIGAEARRMAAASGLGPIGVTWDEGRCIVRKPPHILEIFRGSAFSLMKFSDEEMKEYPEGPNSARTDTKLAAMVRDLARRLR